MFRNLSYLLLLISVSLFSQSIKVSPIKFQSLEKLYSQKSDTLYVINFWATWCKPCIEELPIFKDVSSQYISKKVIFIYVSLDFPKSEEKVSKFMTKKAILGKHFLLDETDANLWISKIDDNWQGEIPATLFINNKLHKKDFHSGEITKESLIKFINSNISKK